MKLFLTVFLLASAAVLAAEVKVIPREGQYIFACGEEAKFNVSVSGRKDVPVKEGKAVCRFFDDHFKLLEEKEINLAEGNPFVLTHTLKTPGFLRCSVTFGKKNGQSVVGFDPLKIVPTQVKPADFEEFWMNAKAEALKIPLDVKLEKLKRLSSDKYTGYAIDFANINGTRMYGYLSVPTAKGRYPAGVLLPGAGPGFAGIPAEYDRSSTIVLALNVHPVPMGGPEMLKENFKKLTKEQHYYFHGLPELKTYVFYRVILGICRGIKVIREMPEWNGTHLAVSGTSQGGGLTIATTALNADCVTAAAVTVPAFGEMVEGVRPAHTRWQKIRSTPEGAKIVSYLDAVNFAPMIRCPMIWSVGLMDQTCYPRTVFAAYNRVKTQKYIWIGIDMTHRVSKDCSLSRKNWLKQQLSKPL